jgi:hypothetical protein
MERALTWEVIMLNQEEDQDVSCTHQRFHICMWLIIAYLVQVVSKSRKMRLFVIMWLNQVIS